jgi:hypothetical protein
MIATTLREIIDRPEFRAGLRSGFALTALVAAAGVVSIRLFRRPVPIAGLVVAIALTKGSQHWDALPPNVPRGLAYLAFAGLSAGVLASLWQPLAYTGLLFAIPGASILTSDTGLPDVSWVAPLVVVSVVVGGTLVADFDRRFHGRGWSVVLFAISVVGVYFTVPDTERALVLLGATLPIVLLGWPFALASLGTVGAYPAVGALVWISAFEGLGRHGSIIGGVACLGLFVVEPIAKWLRLGAATPFETLPTRVWIAIPVACAHLVLVVIASRVVGLRTPVGQAVVLAGATLVFGVAALLALGASYRPRPRSPRRSTSAAR